ncbi:MAG: hypothetical protein ACHP7N_00615 [Caulobacterales bacterium]
MSTTAPIPANVPDVVPVHPVQTAAVTVTAGQADSTPLDDQADLRLVIEEDKAAGSYIYKTVDPRTGKVISQVPREQVLQMRDAPVYSPGTVIDSHS